MNTVIAQTSKGHRIWIQGVFAASGRTTGQRYSVVYNSDTIHIIWSTTGKRKVTTAKGGIIDLEGKRVTQWAQGGSEVTYVYTTAQIVISRVVA